jgi:glycosyltransferase involved in cell wall biosynthesis
MDLLVTLPCFNEAETIDFVIKKIPQTMENVDRVDVLVVDDGSSDGSSKIATQAGAVVIFHHRNMGVGAALQSAIGYALENNYDLLVNIDADGQFDPLQIPALIRPILHGEADFVAGSRFSKDAPIPHMSAIKQWGNRRMNTLISRLACQKFSDVSCGFRAYSRYSLCRLNLHNQFTYTQETFLNLAFNNVRIAEVPIDVTYFPNRKSRVVKSIWQYAFRSLTILLRTYRDYKPLRFFWSIGTAIMVPASVLLIFFIGWRLYSGRFSPHIWAGFMGGSLFFFASSFFIIGLIADMSARLRKNQEDILFFLRSNSNPHSSLLKQNKENLPPKT